jgi:hypothetical protein
MMSAKDRMSFMAELEKALAGREAKWRTEVFFITGELSSERKQPQRRREHRSK